MKKPKGKGRWLRVKVKCIKGQKVDGKEVNAYWVLQEGWRHTSVPGLALTPDSWPEEWVVTHIKSGRCMPGFEGPIDDAKRALLVVAPLADWTLEQDALLAIEGLGRRAYDAYKHLLEDAA